jgi:hypothetical protein
MELLMENKKRDQKSKNPLKLLDLVLQTERYDLGVKYPLWNTNLIARTVEDDIPIFKNTKVGQGTQTENVMSIKRAFPDENEATDEALIASCTSAWHHKPFVDVVHHEVPKLDRGYRPLDTATEMNTFFKIKGTRRNEITDFSKFQYFLSPKIHSENSGFEEQFYLKDSSVETNAINAGKGDEKRLPFSFKELVQCLIETRAAKLKTAEDEMFAYSRINTENKCLYQETGDDDSVLKTASEIAHVENKILFNEQYSCNLFASSHPSDIMENLQNCFQDPYYSYNQNMLHAKAEIIATEGMDTKTPFDVAHYLWERRKERLPYTRMFTKSSVPFSNYEVEANSETCQRI